MSTMCDRARTTWGAASRFSTPSTGRERPRALASRGALMPVLDAMYMGRPLAGQVMRPMVVTPMGKG